jgi:hypothetical protein
LVFLFPPSVALVICGLGGLAYGRIVIHRARRQTFYKPLWEDWVWHALLPCSIYAALAVTALFLHATTQLALFVIGAAALGLLLVGIHNAWDTMRRVPLLVTHDVQPEMGTPREPEPCSAARRTGNPAIPSTWTRAGDRVRTGDVQLGKLAFYR